MNQPTLFPKARATDPQTSHDAAGRVMPRAGSWRRKILDALAQGPMTDDELCEWCDVPLRYWPSLKTARSALKGAGYIVSAGREYEGQTVWKLP